MKKKIFTFLCFIFMTFGLMTGCGGFVEDESLVITSITTELLEDGRTMVIIVYENEDLAPSIFYIPKGDEGIQGEKGDGIESITYDYDKNGDYVLTITFTNDEMEPLVLNLKNGVSVSNITSQFDSTTGDTYLTIVYSDGTTSDPIIIPKGEKGEDGNGIIGITYKTNDDDSTTINIFLADGSITKVQIPAPQKGEDGRGIKAIIGTEDEEYYYIVFEYTDNSDPTIIQFNKPEKPNDWYSGYGTPSSTLGKTGDYYFDLSGNDIYHKIEGIWIIVVEFDDEETKCAVEFRLNGDGAFLPEGYNYKLHHAIPQGSNFASSGAIVPVPQRPGYTFNGWYTTQTPSIVHGAFNDLTTVSSDLILYANWIEKA